jgi:hypothetical protein
VEELGWFSGNIDCCVWHKVTPSGPLDAAVHVDDGVMGGTIQNYDSRKSEKIQNSFGAAS